jgi:DNA-binding GntR family transcriptional regulator
MKVSLSKQRIEHIYQTIRENICLMYYPPGTLIQEAKLAKEFDVSRTPIRQVIKRLEAENLLVSKNGVGTLVTDIEFEQLFDVYEMRLKAAELIGEMGIYQYKPCHLETLYQLRRDTEKLNGISDIDNLALINHKLHKLTTSLIMNSSLRSIFDQYYYQTTRVWFQLMPERWEQEVAELKNEINELIKAVEQNDLVSFGYIKRNFIARVINLLKQKRTNHVKY